jgi:hypothetical protein
MTNSFPAIWGSDPMTTGTDVRNEAQAILNDFRLRLIELISTKRPGDYTSKNLPQLYALASKYCPQLHQDSKLCELHMALAEKKTGARYPDQIVFCGIHAWIDAGMSPIIYFSSPVFTDKTFISLAFLERMLAAGQDLPDREQLLGNLSLEEFSHFLADRVALSRMRYRWLCKLLRTIPDLVAPENWENLNHGHINVHRIFKKKQIESKVSLKALVPLLLLESGQADALYQQAKIELALHDSTSMESATCDAFAANDDEHGQAVLERFIQLEYGRWDDPRLDKVLTGYLSRYCFHTRHNYFHLEERFWLIKAMGVLSQSDHTAVTWPAAIYGNFLSNTILDDEIAGHGAFRWKTLLKVTPELRVIQDYVTRDNSSLFAVLRDTKECRTLAHPILLAQFGDSLKVAYVSQVAPCVASHMMKDMSDGVFDCYETPQATERTLQRYDPECVKQMSEWARQSKDVRELNCRLQGHVSMLWLMIRNLRGEDNKDQAIAWCTQLRSQRTKFEAMRLLGLTLDDIRLAPSLHDEFLSRDLGL